MSYALVTGASKGIGKAIAYDLAARKINLLLIARSQHLLDEVSKDLRDKFSVDVKYLSADLADDNAPENILSWVMALEVPLTILVNNAGYGLSGKFDKYTAHDHAAMMHVNMISPVKLIALFLPLLRSQPRSYILNIASSAAYQAIPNLSTYAASKSFVVSFSRALHHELRKTNVSVTCVSPGGTDTDFGIRADIGKKAIKAGEKVNMTAEAVAAIAVKSMFRKKREVIVGLINRVGAFLTWLAPKSLPEKVAGKLYE